MKFKMTPDKLMIALFSAVLLALPIATIALPKQTRSENENRTLAKFPTIIDQTKWDKADSPKDYWDSVKWKYLNDRTGHAFKDDFETYFCDHIVGRETWVKTCNQLQTMAGKKEINDVYTVDGAMLQTFKTYDKEDVAKAVEAINLFAERHPDMPVSMMIAPTSQEFLSSKIPSYAGLLSEKAFIDNVYEQTENISTIDCLSHLSGHSDEYIYYRTDHHWTSLGAYYAYTSAAKTLGYTPYGASAFNIETASSDFRGTLYSRTLDDKIVPDLVEYYHLRENAPKIHLTTTDSDGKPIENDSLYFREYLEVKDKYSSFTGSNAPIVTIETDVDNGKSLLLIKDSYAHSLVPFLANHYSKITMVDMRYINVDLNMFVDLDSYTQTMFMYNAITFAQDAQHINKVRLTK